MKKKHFKNRSHGGQMTN